MRKHLLLIAAAFAVGIAVGYLLQPAPPADRAARQAAPAPAPAAAVEAAQGGALPSLPPPIAPLPAGDGRIRGRVADDTGAPIEGALVIATPIASGAARKAPKGPAEPPDEEIEEMARQMMAKQRWLREARRIARTGADGTYEVAGLAPIKWNIQAYKEGYQLRASNGYGVEPGASVDFSGSPVVRVDVDVRLPDGSRPEAMMFYATVRTEGGSSTAHETWLAAEPWIELRPGPYEIVAFTESAKSQPQSVTIDAAKPEPLFFQLEARPGLRVNVIRPDDLPSIQPDVMALRFAGATPPDPARLRREGTRTTSHVGQAAVTWWDLEPGPYLIGAAHSYDLPVAVTKVVDVGAGMTEHELRLPPVDPKEYLTVRARGPDGGSPGPLQFTLAHRSAGGATTGIGTNALARADGAYLIARPPLGTSGGGGTHSIVADGPLGRVERVYDPAETREIHLQFDVPAFIDVTITGYAGSEHEGWLNVGLARRDQSNRPWRVLERKPDPQGRCRLGPVQPGSYDLAFYTIPQLWTAAPIPIELRSGEQAATIGVPVLHSLTVRWPGQGTRTFTIRPRDFSGGRVQRDVTEESTTIERMPKGRYEIWVHGGSTKEPIVVGVPEQAEIAIK